MGTQNKYIRFRRSSGILPPPIYHFPLYFHTHSISVRSEIQHRSPYSNIDKIFLQDFMLGKNPGELQ